MLRNFFFLLGLALLSTILLPGNLLAHPGHHEVAAGHSAFSVGLLHPWTGLDHLLAMIAVGLWAAQIGGRALWLVPVSFLVAMGLGAVLGQIGFTLPFLEQGIAASVFLLGLAIAFAVKIPAILPAILVGAFALFHGCAHGAEMPAEISSLGYFGGFLLGTALLHALGLGLGLLLGKFTPAMALRGLGGAIACLGLSLFIF
jgi:urease accessory protein